jgi:hypothetical protein
MMRGVGNDYEDFMLQRFRDEAGGKVAMRVSPPGKKGENASVDHIGDEAPQFGLGQDAGRDDGFATRGQGQGMEGKMDVLDKTKHYKFETQKDTGRKAAQGMT